MAKKMQTTAAMAFTKLLLTVFNITFWLTGLTLLVVGITVLVGLKGYLELSDTDFTNMPYILIGTGLFMIAAGIIGCCAVIKNLSWFLQLYGIMIIVVFIALLAAGVFGFIYRPSLKSGFYTGLKVHMEEYEGRTNNDSDLAIDFVQSRLDCCGVQNYTVWLDKNSWWQQNVGHSVLVPSSCCDPSTGAECTLEPSGVPIKTDNGTLGIYKNGCAAKVTTFLDSKLTMMAAICIAFAFYQLVGMILSFCLAKLINANKYEMV